MITDEIRAFHSGLAGPGHNECNGDVSPTDQKFVQNNHMVLQKIVPAGATIAELKKKAARTANREHSKQLNLRPRSSRKKHWYTGSGSRRCDLANGIPSNSLILSVTGIFRQLAFVFWDVQLSKFDSECQSQGVYCLSGR